MSPTDITSISINLAPYHKIPIVKRFIVSIIIGIIEIKVLLTCQSLSYSSLLETSKRFSSFLSVLKALITNNPSNNSRMTLFNLSIKVCIFLNLGSAKIRSKIIQKAITPIATNKIHNISGYLITLKIEVIPIKGAINIILRHI